jgi:hypothetical protein
VRLVPFLGKSTQAFERIKYRKINKDTGITGIVLDSRKRSEDTKGTTLVRLLRIKEALYLEEECSSISLEKKMERESHNPGKNSLSMPCKSIWSLS